MLRILTVIVQLALTALLFSCDQQHSASDINSTPPQISIPGWDLSVLRVTVPHFRLELSMKESRNSRGIS
jgi:hypothetical protein